MPEKEGLFVRGSLMHVQANVRLSGSLFLTYSTDFVGPLIVRRCRIRPLTSLKAKLIKLTRRFSAPSLSLYFFCHDRYIPVVLGWISADLQEGVQCHKLIPRLCQDEFKFFRKEEPHFVHLLNLAKNLIIRDV